MRLTTTVLGMHDACSHQDAKYRCTETFLLSRKILCDILQLPIDISVRASRRRATWATRHFRATSETAAGDVISASQLGKLKPALFTQQQNLELLWCIMSS
jgi:hypothetical protein